jgi:hypothetical protein
VSLKIRYKLFLYPHYLWDRSGGLHSLLHCVMEETIYYEYLGRHYMFNKMSIISMLPLIKRLESMINKYLIETIPKMKPKITWIIRSYLLIIMFDFFLGDYCFEF